MILHLRRKRVVAISGFLPIGYAYGIGAIWDNFYSGRELQHSQKSHLGFNVGRKTGDPKNASPVGTGYLSFFQHDIAPTAQKGGVISGFLHTGYAYGDL